MTLKNKFIFSFAGVVLFVALVISFPILITQSLSTGKQVRQISTLQAEKIYKEMEIFIKEPTADMNAMLSFITTTGFNDRESFEGYLKSLSTDKNEYSMIYFATPYSIKDGGIVYNNIGWKPNNDYDATGRDWYRKAVSAKNSYVFSDPYIDAQSGEVVVTISKALYNGSTLIGVGGLDLKINRLQSLAEDIALTETCECYMLDKTGNYVSNPDSSKIGKVNFFEDRGFEQYKNEKGENGLYMNLNARKETYLVMKEMPSICGWTVVTFGSRTELYYLILQNGILVILLTLGTILLAAIIAYFIVKPIIKPILKITKSLMQISEGNADLTQRVDIKSNDEIGKIASGFNKFIEKLQSIITQVKNSKNILSDSGEMLLDSTQDTTTCIEEILSNIATVHGQINTQCSNVDQTAGAVNEIAANIESLERLIENQSSSVTQASAAVEQMIGNIMSVNTSVEKMANSFDSLHEDANTGATLQQDVNDKITLIESQSQMLQEANAAISAIAEQTNLLAMNAAIEAAHAGEAGKGFSVVADEIRKLSETSAEQSRTIGDQLTNIQGSIAKVVQASNESSEAFQSVSSKILETDQIVRQIKAAMEEQQTGSKQIIDALQNMNETTSEVHLSSQEMSQGNKLILNEINQLQEATFTMKDSIGVMTSGARKIGETGLALKDISDKMKDAITDIGNEIDKFIV